MAAGDHQLLLAVVQDIDAGDVCDALIAAGFPGPTRVPSRGGFLAQGNTTLLVAVERHRVTEVLRVIAGRCQIRAQYVNPLPPLVSANPGDVTYPFEVHVGGAVVFIFDLDRYERW